MVHRISCAIPGFVRVGALARSILRRLVHRVSRALASRGASIGAGQTTGIVRRLVFAFTMVVDGLGHSILAVVSIGYFPGLFTSPLVGICGLWLLLRLLDLTDRWSVGIREGGRIDADQ